MQIIIKTNELNARRNGEAYVNGIDVEIIGAELVGSEKQIDWANKIMADAVREIVKLKLKEQRLDGICDGAALDACIDACNKFLAGLAPRLAGTRAAQWIDNRHLSGRQMINALCK